MSFVEIRPTDKIEGVFRLVESQKKALKKIGLTTLRDLLYYFPVRYGDVARVETIVNMQRGETVTIFGKISKLKISKGYKSKIPMAEATIEDDTGSIKAIWFHQPYIAKIIPEGASVKLSGVVSERKGSLYISNPEHEVLKSLPDAKGESLFGTDTGWELHASPIYSESRGITSRWIRHAILKLLKLGLAEKLDDPIPEEILIKYNLPKLNTALVWVHSPRKKEDALSARKRFSFEEIFLIQMKKGQERKKRLESPSMAVRVKLDEVGKFTDRFPFAITGSQKKCIDNILSDFQKNYPMARLLEGDVGSGKTAVAAATAFAVVTSVPQGREYGHLQVAYMAPTEILAAQHFESFIKYFSYLGLSVGLITGSKCKKFPSKVRPTEATEISKSQLLKWVANGDIPILVGTHALIQKAVKFKNLAYVIIDEQHRFGTAQRQILSRKDNIIPHLLSMTATPIPRTLALTLYGDLDLSLLDEMPLGRKPVITEIVGLENRGEVYKKMREEIEKGRQAYVICPRIDLPDEASREDLFEEENLYAKSVKSEAKRLKKEIFPEFEVGIMHGKMTPKEKEKSMKAFEEGKTNILVSTSVIEVGVNVPNATVILIEGGERFGLAQLHQLRGRVIRSNHQSYCFVFFEGKSEKTISRLKALATAKNGFELAELDLLQRGAGELTGGRQWGVSDIAMDAIRNMKMVEAARNESRAILERDKELSSYPILKERIEKMKEIHFE